MTSPGPAPPDDRPVGRIDEWVFAAWSADADLGVLSGHRLVGGRAWYWSALVQAGYGLVHLTEWEIGRRASPFVVKAHELWAEHHCVVPYEQWTVGNEGYFAVLDDADEALGRAYGMPTPVSFDLEWYATGEPTPVRGGFAQDGVVHGLVEIGDRPHLELEEVPAQRWRRATDDPVLGPVELPVAVAHRGLRAPFAFPDGTVADWVLTPSGWRSRRR